MANFTFGFEEMLKILDGMFAFALYNKKWQYKLQKEVLI